MTKNKDSKSFVGELILNTIRSEVADTNCSNTKYIHAFSISDIFLKETFSSLLFFYNNIRYIYDYEKW